MIKIIEERITQDIDGSDISRHTDTIISDGVVHYALGVGGLPLKGDLQPVLDAREAELWKVAVVKDNTLDAIEARELSYNSPLAGGWTNNEFQEAILENNLGQAAKLTAIQNKRAAIKADWPLA